LPYVPAYRPCLRGVDGVETQWTFLRAGALNRLLSFVFRMHIADETGKTENVPTASHSWGHGSPKANGTGRVLRD